MDVSQLAALDYMARIVYLKFPTLLTTKHSISETLACELSESIRNMTAALSKEELSQRQTMSRQKVSKEAVHSTLKHFTETLSSVSKVQTK